jgi:hypothetical protein
MIEVLNSIESKIKGHQEDLQKKSTYLSNINDALKKLSSDKEVTISEINALQGAIHGYSESLKLLKEKVETKVDG